MLRPASRRRKGLVAKSYCAQHRAAFQERLRRRVWRKGPPLARRPLSLCSRLGRLAYSIGEFTRWKDHDAYQKALDRLLRDLRVEKS